MLNHLKKIFSIFLIFNLTFVTSAQAAAVSFNDFNGDGTGFDLSAQETDQRGFTFNNDGTKMFVLGTVGDDVNEYTLSSPFDVSTAVFRDFNNDGTGFDVSAQETVVRDVAFNNDGTKMYVTGQAGKDVNEYTLSTAFDVSTATHRDFNGDGTGFSLVAQDTGGVRGFAFNNDGTKMFIIGAAGQDVNEYTLSTAFDVSTAVFRDINGDGTGFSLAQDTANRGLAFNNDGTKMFATGNDGDDVNEYTLSTAFDVSTAVFRDINGDGTGFSFATQETGARALAFNNDGTKMFVLGNSGDDVNEYILSNGFDLFGDPNDNKDVKAIIDAQVQLAKESIKRSIVAVSDRLSYLRANRTNDDLSKNNIKLKYGDAVLISNHTKKSIIPEDWSSWSEGSIGMTEIDAKTNSSKIDIDTQSLAVGFDKKLNNNDLLGFALQYAQSDTDVGSSGSAIDSKNYNLSLYRTRPLEDDNFIEGLIGIGFLENDITRKSDANTNTGSRNGNQLYGSVNYGKTIDKGDFNLTPTARVDLGYTELDAYTETGTHALSYDKQTVESGLASLGLAFDNIVKFENSSLKPFGSIEYGYDFSNSSDVKMNYVGSAKNFTVNQSDTSDHLLSSEIGFEFIAKNNLNLTASYKRTEGDQDMSTDAIKFRLNFKSKQETEYAMTLDGSEDLAAGFNVVKNINGFDLSLNAKQAFNENADQAAKVSLSRSF